MGEERQVEEKAWQEGGMKGHNDTGTKSEASRSEHTKKSMRRRKKKVGKAGS